MSEIRVPAQSGPGEASLLACRHASVPARVSAIMCGRERAPILLAQGPTLTSSSNHNHLPQGPVFKYSHTADQGFNMRGLGTVQSAAVGVCGETVALASPEASRVPMRQHNRTLGRDLGGSGSSL